MLNFQKPTAIVNSYEKFSKEQKRAIENYFDDIQFWGADPENPGTKFKVLNHL